MCSVPVKNNTKHKSLKILEEIAEDKKNYHSTVLKLLEAKDKRSERKLQLLEQIATNLSNK